MAFAVLTDFDGTLTKVDVAASIVMNFSTGNWREIEQEYHTGKISSRDELVKQFNNVPTSKQELLEFVDRTAEFDPAFRRFQDYCNEMGIPILVVSEGLDFYIDFLLNKHDIEAEVCVNRARFTDNGIEIDFPFINKDCDKCGNCKMAHLERYKNEGKEIIYIGDGRSDFCPAKEADIIFAKAYLAEHLDTEGIKYFKYEDFDDIITMMENVV